MRTLSKRQRELRGRFLEAIEAKNQNAAITALLNLVRHDRADSQSLAKAAIDELHEKFQLTQLAQVPHVSTSGDLETLNRALAEQLTELTFNPCVEILENIKVLDRAISANPEFRRERSNAVQSGRTTARRVAERRTGVRSTLKSGLKNGLRAAKHLRSALNDERDK